MGEEEDNLATMLVLPFYTVDNIDEVLDVDTDCSLGQGGSRPQDLSSFASWWRYSGGGSVNKQLTLENFFKVSGGGRNSVAWPRKRTKRKLKIKKSLRMKTGGTMAIGPKNIWKTNRVNGKSVPVQNDDFNQMSSSTDNSTCLSYDNGDCSFSASGGPAWL